MTWAIVEVMGHRRRAGLISDATIGGATLLRIEHPTRAAHTGEEPLCEYYSPQAIFAIRPCSREDAEKEVEYCWAAPAERPTLGAGLEDLVVDDDDVEDAEPW